MKPIEIEIDGPCNERLHFRPLQKSIRGRFDMMRIGEPMAKVKAQEWPTAIPSQRLGIDPDGTGYVMEPLHDDEHAAIKEKIERRGQKLEPAVQEFENIHLPSWLYWIKRAVESELATVVKGTLPDKIEGEPIKNFIIAKPEPSSTDKLTDALTEQTKAFNTLAAALQRLVESK